VRVELTTRQDAAWSFYTGYRDMMAICKWDIRKPAKRIEVRYWWRSMLEAPDDSACLLFQSDVCSLLSFL
jgi:hypothetical protein